MIFIELSSDSIHEKRSESLVYNRCKWTEKMLLYKDYKILHIILCYRN